jgi:hypothetical protein
MCVNKYACMHACVYTGMRVHSCHYLCVLYVHVFMCMCVHMCMFMCLYASRHMFGYTHVRMCVCTHTVRLMPTYTHTHTFTCMSLSTHRDGAGRGVQEKRRRMTTRAMMMTFETVYGKSNVRLYGSMRLSMHVSIRSGNAEEKKQEGRRLRLHAETVSFVVTITLWRPSYVYSEATSNGLIQLQQPQLISCAGPFVCVHSRTQRYLCMCVCMHVCVCMCVCVLV